VIGLVGGAAIKLVDIERIISLDLYDLEMQRYRLLRGALETRLLERLDAPGAGSRVAEIRLKPPIPPRMAITIDPERSRPEGTYPIQIVAFCNLESSHCIRLQEQLSRILPMFEGVAQYSDRDLILPFHRHAALAARAGYCAREQGRYWQYRDLLFAVAGPPDLKRIFRAANAIGLVMDQFQTCLDSQLSREKLDSDALVARSLGITSVPAVFVNGLYAGVNPEPGHLIWLIEREVRRLKIDSPRMLSAERQSREPLVLSALIHPTEPGQGMAMLAPSGVPASGRFYREGDALGADLTVRRVKDDRVELLNGGVTEWIGFDGPPDRAEGPSASLDEPDIDPKDQAILDYPHRALPIALDRTDVLVRMADINAVEESLETVPITAGGYHLLRIADIEPGSLYELLGLEQGDVILLVNEQPMHEGDKPLWNALQSDDEVRLRVMRQGGIAHHYTYRFEE
jgi:type II secretory pathway component PulC